jgi:hydroxymethylbilane synthase
MAATLRLGTRGSALALYQANWTADRLRAHDPTAIVEIVLLKTTGDLRQDVSLGAMAGKGVFVREIEAALLRGEIDIAVHSAKDMQSTDPPGLTIAAFSPREDPRDALVAPRYGSLDSLPTGAVVATGAPRRVAQLRMIRPDLRFTEIRGNVDTRLAKLERGDADALVLAVAGLVRLGRESVISERLSIDVSLPQVGQAAIAIQCRADATATVERVRTACDDAPTRVAVEIERAFLAQVGGGCTAPVAAYARIIDEEVELMAFLAEDADSGDEPTRACHAVQRANRSVAQAFLPGVVYADLMEHRRGST